MVPLYVTAPAMREAFARVGVVIKKYKKQPVDADYAKYRVLIVWHGYYDMDKLCDVAANEARFSFQCDVAVTWDARLIKERQHETTIEVWLAYAERMKPNGSLNWLSDSEDGSNE